MSSFKDQLSDWNKDHDDLEGAAPKPPQAPEPIKTNKACRVISRPMRKGQAADTMQKTNAAAQKYAAADPLYAAPEHEEEEEEEEIDDADLFSAAVADINSQSAAILAKYDATVEAGATRVGTSQEGAPVAGEAVEERARVNPDEMAFLNAMGGLGGQDSGQNKARQLKKK
ncbi:MAG: hypothetical protein GY822_32430 [Deltaproteobacteria bacterium]|nr:hypothetical protein [Deltaproteobacteria bacterium]